MANHYPEVPYERYVDDVVIHCNNFKEALRLLEQIKARFKRCKLEAHREKTKLVYCKRNQKYHPPFKVQYCTFDFLDFTFKTRRTRAKWGHLQLVYTPTMSKTAYKRVGEVLRELKLHRMVHLRIQDLAHIVAP